MFLELGMKKHIVNIKKIVLASKNSYDEKSIDIIFDFGYIHTIQFDSPEERNAEYKKLVEYLKRIKED